MKPSIHHTLFLLLSFAIHASYSSNPLNFIPKSPIENIYSPSNGEIPIQRDPDGFFINADLADSSQTANDTVKMTLSLSDNGVLLVDSCLNFNQYPCDYYHCSKYPDPSKNINYSTFNASVIEASAPLSLDSQYWELQENVLIATSCSTLNSLFVGTGRYGILGLGTQGDSYKNFLKTRLFSIYLDIDFQGGVLKFANDHEKYANGSPLGTLPANSNWIVPISGGVHMYLPNFAAPAFTGNLAFDINADILGLPLDLFEKVMYFMAVCQWPRTIVCSADNVRPTCNYTGYVKNLPDIWVSTGDLGVRFHIPVELYVKDFKSREDFVNSVTLNFKALDPTLKGDSYVTPEYANTIILDGRTMSQFYFIFDASKGSNTIQVYPANPNATHSKPRPPHPNPKNPSYLWIYISAGCLIVLVVIIACCAVIKRNMKNSENRRGSSRYIDAAPLIAAAAAVDEDSEYTYQINKDLNKINRM